MSARCGRCGLFGKYPDNHHEKKHAGVCLWYQIRLADHDVWEPRECSDFFEAIPGMHPMDHFDYKIKRDNLGDAYTAALRASRTARISICISLVGLGVTLFKVIQGVLHG